MRAVRIALVVAGAFLVLAAFGAALLGRYVYTYGININMKAILVGAFVVILGISLFLLGMRVSRRTRGG